MKNQVLSIEQMRHLRELGVDTSKASMFYVPKLQPKDEYCLLNVKPNPVIPYVPAFTLQDIIELLPSSLVDGHYRLFIAKDGNNEYYFQYIGAMDVKASFKSCNMLEAAYQMLCWCAENGFLKGGGK